MADIFQEIEEDVRRERFERLWKRYAPIIIGVVLVIVVGVAGVTGWRAYVSSERLESSDRFNAALAKADAGDREAAITEFAVLAGDAREPYATLARLREAGLRAENGDKQAAAAAFTQAANATDDPLMREYAELMAVVETIDSSAPDEVIARLEPFTAAGRLWRALARDYLAFVAYKKGDLARARQVWDEISKDDQSAPAQRARANELLAATAAAADANKGSK